MNDYEITYIVTPSLSEEERAQVDTDIDKVLEELDATITHNTTSLRRKLAYPVRKQATGFLRVIQAQLDPQHTDTVREFLQRHAHVMRFSILNTPGRQDVSPTIFEAASKTKTPAKAASKPKKPKREVTMEEVDEKIEKALEEEVK